MSTHTGTLAWEIPWTEEPGGLHGPHGRKELDMTEVTKHSHEKCLRLKRRNRTRQYIDIVLIRESRSYKSKDMHI